MGYHLWDPEAKKIIRSHDVVFNEKKMHKQFREVETRKVSFQDIMPPIVLPRRANVESQSVQREGSSNDHSSQQEERIVVHQCRVEWCQVTQLILKCQLNKSQWY